MSVPVLTGLTLIDNANTVTGWSGWGANSSKWGISTEIYKQGAASNALQPRSTGDGGWGFQTGSNVDLSANLVMVWVWMAATPFITNFATTPSGVYIRITNSTSSWTTTYDDYYVGGADIAWAGRGWHLIVLDVNRTRDRGSGTVTLSTIRRIGVGFNQAVTAGKSDVIAIDTMHYGNTLEVTGPSFIDGTNGIDINTGGTIDRNDGGSFVTDGWEVGDFVKITGSATSANDGVYEITGVAAGVLTTGESFTQDTANTTAQIFCSVTLEDIYQKDGPTDDNWKGVVDKDPSGAYVINYPLTIGDVSGALDCFFLSRGESVVLADQPMSTTKEDYLVTAEDTGETHVLFGASGGTGDDRVGFAGSVFTGQPSIFGTSTPRGVDMTAEITSLELYGSSFIELDAGLLFAATATDHYITTCGFTACGQIDTGAAECRGLTFAGYSGTAGALLWDTGIDIKDSRFFANSRGIEMKLTTNQVYDAMFFAGNTYDTHLNNGGTDIDIAKNNLSDPSTQISTGGGTITYTSVAVTTQITVRNIADQTVISGARILLLAGDGTGDLPYNITLTSITRVTTTATVTFPSPHGLTTDDVIYINGANEEDYNGTWPVASVPSTTTVTYVMNNDPGGSATGTPLKGTGGYFNELSNGSGIVTDTRSLSSPQPMEGWARKATTSPLYKQAPINETVDDALGLSLTVYMIPDE